MCQIFILPKFILQKINVIYKHYLWHDTWDNYVAWDEVCHTKSSGGLGVRNLGLWNQAANASRISPPSAHHLEPHSYLTIGKLRKPPPPKCLGKTAWILHGKKVRRIISNDRIHLIFLILPHAIIIIQPLYLIFLFVMGCFVMEIIWVLSSSRSS